LGNSRAGMKRNKFRLRKKLRGSKDGENNQSKKEREKGEL